MIIHIMMNKRERLIVGIYTTTATIYGTYLCYQDGKKAGIHAMKLYGNTTSKQFADNIYERISEGLNIPTNTMKAITWPFWMIRDVFTKIIIYQISK